MISFDLFGPIHGNLSFTQYVLAYIVVIKDNLDISISVLAARTNVCPTRKIKLNQPERNFLLFMDLARHMTLNIVVAKVSAPKNYDSNVGYNNNAAYELYLYLLQL
jgi:hypothetical protein